MGEHGKSLTRPSKAYATIVHEKQSHFYAIPARVVYETWSICPLSVQSCRSSQATRGGLREITILQRQYCRN